MKIVIDQHGIVVVDGGNGIEQRRHNERFFVTDKFFEKVWYKIPLNTDKG